MPIDVVFSNSTKSTAHLEWGQANALSASSDMPAACPYCGSSDNALYCRGRTAVILRCHNCGGFYDPNREGEITPDGTAIDQVTREYLSSYRDDESSELAIARNVVTLLRERVPGATRFLEFGCGNAAIGQVAAADRLPITYTGIELSAALYAAISPYLRNRILHQPTLIEALDRVPNGSQDIVILHHVLEHLPDPRDSLALLRQKLAAEGRFFIEVPNEQWKRRIMGLRRMLKPSGDDWFPGHINFFTQTSLRNFLAAQGFEIEYERKVTAASYPEMVKKMLGGESKFRTSLLARMVYAGLRWSKLESLIGYGIVLRCLCRPSAPNATHE
jgi:SAM-dependent methyltransferase